MINKNNKRIIRPGQKINIRALKKCQQELKILKQALHHSGTVLWSTDYCTNKISAVDTWVKLLGYPLDEAESSLDFFKEAIHPEDRKRELEARERHFNGELPEFHVVFRMRTKKGSYRWIRARGRFVERDENGKPLGMVGIHEDITQQRQMIDKIHKSEEKYQLLYNTMKQAMAYHQIITDEEGNPRDYLFLEVNNAFERHTGLKKEELIGKTVLEVLPETEKEWIERYGNVALSGKSEHFIQFSKALNRYYEVDAYCPKTGYFAVLFNDITERIQASQELKHQKAIMDGLFRTSPDALVLIDCEGIILRINKRFTEIFHYAAEEALGKHVDELIANQNQREAAQELNRRARVTLDLEVETQRTRKDGCLVPVMIRSQPYYLDEKIIGHQIIYTDIRHRKEQEEILRRAKEEADQANEAKSRFLSNISHEMRTPMNGIYGAAMLLETTELSAEQQELVEMLKESSDRMMNTVADLLDISKLEQSAVVLKEERFDLCKTLQKSVEPFQKMGEKRKIQFLLKCHVDTSPLVWGDAGKLRRVLYHLIGNAFKFTKKGQIVVEVSLKEYQTPISIFRFMIKDTGIGIHQEEMHQLFNTFTQLDDSNKKTYQGSGLGLTIVHKLLEQMGGTVHVESSPHKGSLFYFDLPLRVETSENCLSESSEEELLATERKPSKILAVEDDKISQLLLKKLTQEMGFDLEVVADGLKAIEAYGENQYDLILMDVQLPSISGLEVTSVIRSFESRTDEHTPIIGISAHAMNKDKEECLAVGMDDYMAKPIDFKQLSHIIKKWTHK
ncbi:PAS domain S-box protein [Tindallia californiensis]|uniref:Circadian input-output histidine kinase CikA n=1 Tax=Tindallia californiensis TaxID=159292 RepID=A0A1H3LE20_9FIRM|nr:PAS domain S-box protein [Tindallia californiensis]SDY62653.1 PAS domain S-box-containing protein [Tindallia californiensis]